MIKRTKSTTKGKKGINFPMTGKSRSFGFINPKVHYPWICNPRPPSQSKKELRALALLSFGPHPASVPVYDLIGYSQAHSCTLKISGGMQPLKWYKKLTGKPHVKTSTVIFDIIGNLAADLFCSDPYLGMGSLAGVLDGI